MTKKLVLKVGVHDEKSKQKAMQAVSSLAGIESLSMDMNEKKMTVIGGVDPVKVVSKLKKFGYTELLAVGPAKEPEKKKEEEKKVEVKKVEAKPAEGEMKKTESEQIKELLELYKKQYPQYTQYYSVHSVEENPNACVIC